MHWSSVVPTVTGGLLAIGGGLLGQLFSRWLEAARIRAALVAEVSGFFYVLSRTHLIESRRYQQTGVFPKDSPFFCIPTQPEYFAVYRNNVDKLGLLRRKQAAATVAIYSMFYHIQNLAKRIPDEDPQDAQEEEDVIRHTRIRITLAVDQARKFYRVMGARMPEDLDAIPEERFVE